MATKGKTIKEIADELGVSKQAVSYRLKQIQTAKKDTFLATKENGVLVVSLAAEKLIVEAFAESDRQKDHQKERPKDRQKDEAFLAVLEATIDTLKGQLEAKDKQIEMKDSQIEEMQQQAARLHEELAEERRHSREQAEKLAVLADQAQRLQLAQMHPELTAGGGAEAQDEPEAPPEPMGLFQRLFRRK